MKKLVSLLLLIVLIPLANINASDSFDLQEIIVRNAGYTVADDFKYDHQVEVFVGSTIEILIDNPSDKEIFFYANEFTDNSLVTFVKEGDVYSSNELNVSKAGQFIIFIQTNEDFFITVDLIVYDKVNTISIVSEDFYPLINDDILLSLQINKSDTVLVSDINTNWYANDILITEYNSKTDLDINFKSADIVLDLEVKAISIYQEEEIESEIIVLHINNAKFTEYFELLDQDKVFLLENKFGYINAKISKDSKALIKISDLSNSIRFISYEKSRLDEDFDLLKIKVELLKTNVLTAVISCSGNIDGNTALFSKTIKLNILEKINTFTISSNYESIEFGEQIIVSSTVNDFGYIDVPIMWYVDGELLEDQTNQITYSFDKGGNHIIKATINGVDSNEVKIFVDYTNVEVLIWYCLLGFAIVLGIPFIFYISKKRNRSRLKLIEKKCSEINLYLKQLEKKYKKSKSKDNIKVNFKRVIGLLEGVIVNIDYEKYIYNDVVYDELKSNVSKAKKILEVVNKMYGSKSTKEIAKLISDANMFLNKSLINIESIHDFKLKLKSKKK